MFPWTPLLLVMVKKTKIIHVQDIVLLYPTKDMINNFRLETLLEG